MRHLGKSSLSSRRGKTIKEMFLMGLGSAVFIFLLIASAGCQGRFTFETNAYYPDHTGNKRVGDPRKPMFEGSGYAEDEGRTSPSSGYARRFEDSNDD